MNKRHLSLALVPLFLLLISFLPFKAGAIIELTGLDEIIDEDILNEDYYRMLSEEGEILLETGRMIVVDDEYLTSDNRLFRVFAVEGKTARARFVERIDLKKHMEENFRAQVRAVLAAGSAQGEEDDEGEGEGGGEEPRQLVAIYHTHNAESYIPSDGTHSINGIGGIHQVGKAFKEALEAQGINVIHDETLHLPHDRGAYRRSRVTAQRLLAQGPDVIFDVHRDAAPADAYAAHVDDTVVTQVQFVVGRQNHNFSINRSFAYDLKGYADDLQPELIKGVFFAHGNYNQDLTPLNLLLEVGAHNNTREQAEEGIAIFANTVDFYFYGPDPGEAAPPVPGADAPSGTGLGFLAASRTILAIVAILLLGGLGLLWINAGSSQEFLRIVTPYLERSRDIWSRFLVSLIENWAFERDTAIVREKWRRTRVSLKDKWNFERDTAIVREKWQGLKNRFDEIRRKRLE